MRLGTILPLRAFFEITDIPFIRRRYHGHFRVVSSPLITCFVAREKPCRIFKFCCRVTSLLVAHNNGAGRDVAVGMGCCTWMNVPHRVELIWPRTQGPLSISKITSSWRKEAIVESEAVNAHRQPSAWGIVTTKHSPRFANHGALTKHEKPETASDRTTVVYGRNPNVLPWLRLTVISKNGKIIIPKHRQVHQRWLSLLICMKESLIKRYLSFRIDSLSTPFIQHLPNIRSTFFVERKLGKCWKRAFTR